MQAVAAQSKIFRSVVGGMALLMVGCASATGPFAAPPSWSNRVNAVAHDAQVVAELPANATLRDYLRYADEHNPAIRQAQARWRSASERSPQERTLPDPSFNAGYDSMDVETRVGVSQAFPFPGKLSMRGAVADYAAAAARQDLEATRRQVHVQVTDAYAQYTFLHRAVELRRQFLDLAERMEEVALARVRAGAPHADAIRAQIELDHAHYEFEVAEDSIVSAIARLNAALGRPADAPLPTPANLISEISNFKSEISDFKSQIETNPQLQALREQINESRQAMQLARREGYPDFMIGVDYMRDPHDTGLGVMFSMTIPLQQSRYRAAQRQATHDFHAAVEALHDRQNTLQADVQMALFSLRDAQRRIDLYRDVLLPRAEQSLRATETAYQADAVDFQALVEAYRMPLEMELALHQAHADHLRALAELESLVGPLDSSTEPRGERHEPAPKH